MAPPYVPNSTAELEGRLGKHLPDYTSHARHRTDKSFLWLRDLIRLLVHTTHSMASEWLISCLRTKPNKSLFAE